MVSDRDAKSRQSRMSAAQKSIAQTLRLSSSDSRKSDTVAGSFMDEEVQKRARMYDVDRVYKSYSEISDHDMKRNNLINISRSKSVAWSGITGFHPQYIIYTSLPRMLWSPTLWGPVLIFALTATLTRLGVITHRLEEYDDGAMQNSELLFSLLMAFYLGHCYNRYYAVYYACMDCRNSVFDCCALAAVYLYDVPDVWKVWRYTNLAHVTTMVSVSPAYTVENLYNPYVAEQELLKTEDEHERQMLAELNMQFTGMRGPQTCVSWAMAVVSDARRAGRLEKPEGVTLSDK
jgi:hypothetical protein